MFNRILVALDNSPPAAHAVEVAAGLAEQVGGVIGLLHVVDSSRAFCPELQVLDKRIMARLRFEANEVLDAAMSRLPRRASVERLLLEGEPVETILEISRDWRADVIIIGNDSRGRVAHFLLGSTADAVIRRAECPVMTVRATPPTTGDAPLRQGGIISEMKAGGRTVRPA